MLVATSYLKGVSGYKCIFDEESSGDVRLVLVGEANCDMVLFICSLTLLHSQDVHCWPSGKNKKSLETLAARLLGVGKPDEGSHARRKTFNTYTTHIFKYCVSIHLHALLQFAESRGYKTGKCQQLANGIDGAHVPLRQGVLRRVVKELEGGPEIAWARLNGSLQMRGNDRSEAPFANAFDPLERGLASALVDEGAHNRRHKDLSGNLVERWHVGRPQKARHQSAALPLGFALEGCEHLRRVFGDVDDRVRHLRRHARLNMVHFVL